MKRYLLFTLSLVLVFAFVGCSHEKEIDTTTTISSSALGETEQTSGISDSNDVKAVEELTTIEVSFANSALDAYKAVLLNEREFYSTDNKKNLYLNDFLTNKEIYEITFKVTNFTVLDMDGDKVPEVVLELSLIDIPQFYEVFHYVNNMVYGCFFTYRSLGELKADGTFMFSSSAADSGVGRLEFGLENYDVHILGCIKPNENDTELTVSYFIDDKLVTKEEYEVFIEEQSEKKDATWHEFSQENIENEFKEVFKFD